MGVAIGAGTRGGRLPDVVAARVAEAIDARPAVIWAALPITLVLFGYALNLFGYPYLEDDEGTYLAQAWAVVHSGQLAPYTYWYDHPPLGWIQLGLMSTLTGGFNSFGVSVVSGRVLMLPYFVGTVLLIYVAARRSGRTAAAAAVAVLAFGFSAYELHYGRRVLLDSLAGFWLLASLVPLLSDRLTLSRVWVSAACLGIGILSKEIDVVFAPAMAALVVARVDRSQRLLAGAGWVAIVGCVASGWVLLAVLKGELFPFGTALGGASPHVSLLGTLAEQAARGRDGGLLQVSSGFWRQVATWAVADPLLVVGGTVAAIVAVLAGRRSGAGLWIGLLTFSGLLFLGRGGETLPHYLLPLMPLLALNLAWLFDALRDVTVEIGSHPSASVLARLRPAANSVIAGGILVGAAASVGSGGLGMAAAPFMAWTSSETAGQIRAVDWVRTYLPRDARIASDMYAWLDLQEPPSGEPRFDFAHYYWKVDKDPEIAAGVLGNRWQNIDYVLATPQLLADARVNSLPISRAAVDHSDVLASFEGWPVTVYRTRVPQTHTAVDDHLLQQLWNGWLARFVANGRVTDASADASTRLLEASLAMLTAVYMDDQGTFDAMWRSNQWAWSGPGRGTAADRDSPLATETYAALALAVGSQRWGDPRYLQEARMILRDIWTTYTADFGHGRLAFAHATATEKAGDRRVIDLSALVPSAYRVFAAMDPDRPWSLLVDGTYELLRSVQRDPELGVDALVRRWLTVGPRDGVESLSADRLESDHGFDVGMRQLGWNVGIDWLWNHDQRAHDVLSSLGASQPGGPPTSWLDGADRTSREFADGGGDIATSAAALPPVLFGGDVELASSMFTRDVLAPLFNDGRLGSRDAADGLWGWFATALFDGGFVDLTQPARSVDWSRALASSGSSIPGVSEHAHDAALYLDESETRVPHSSR